MYVSCVTLSINLRQPPPYYNTSTAPHPAKKNSEAGYHRTFRTVRQRSGLKRDGQIWKLFGVLTQTVGHWGSGMCGKVDREGQKVGGGGRGDEGGSE